MTRITDWSDSLVETLRQLWAEGRSCSQIADRIGFTRNAVIGKANRLGLEQRRAPPQRGPRMNKPRVLKRTGTYARFYEAKQGEQLKDIPLDLSDPPQDQCITIFQINAHTCHWICHDGKYDEKRYCGRPSLAGHPYCRSHQSICRVPAPRRTQHRHDGFILKTMGER